MLSVPSLARPRLRLLAGLFCATLTALAHAGDDPRRTLDRIDVVGERIERADAGTGTRLDLGLRELPASVTVIERDTLDARGVRTTQEALFGIPGLSVASPPGHGNAVTYRGFSGSQITQLFNGIGVQYDAIAARPVDGWIYERVEAVGGPSSFLHGAGAVGGSINYVTGLADPSRDRTEFLASHASFDSQVAAVRLNRRLGDGEAGHAVRVDAGHSATDGWVDRSDREAWTAAASLRTALSPALTHTLALEYHKEDSHRPYWGTPVRQPASGRLRLLPGTRRGNYNVGDGYYGQEVVWARSLTEWRRSETTRWRNTLYHYDALRDYRNVETYRLAADNSLVERSGVLLQRHDQQLYGNRLEWLHDGRLGTLETQWSAGLDLSFNRQTRFPHSLPGVVDLVDPAATTPGGFFDIPGMRPGFDPDRTNRLHARALFLENHTRLPGRLSLLTGLRHDRIDLDVVNFRTPTASNPPRFENRYSPTTGRAGLSFAWTPAATLYAQYSTAADPPAGILTTANFGTLQDFDLSTGRQVEAGGKFEFLDGRASATLAGYRIVRRNLAIADPANPGETLPVGQQSSRGVEIAFGLRPATSLRIDGNLAWSDASLDEFVQQIGDVAVSLAGNRPANTPARVGNLWLDYALSPRWSAGADVRAVSSRHADQANTLDIAGYVVFGAHLRWQPLSGTSLTLRVRNLGDHAYASHVTATPMLYLGESRALELSLRTAL